ncbi:hypothetical protein CC86DRAFT_423720 [Ophiobolus disseminans]|uniref:Uncharacterized protein n=1 Tax=Ophiobolus disseminans TaxID=1469910 RepID=A0A6A6ZQE1_9PLEO|nr:hypothetical protein CC86DRAFT_423720 [Ophiobolus disseminans]
MRPLAPAATATPNNVSEGIEAEVTHQLVKLAHFKGAKHLDREIVKNNNLSLTFFHSSADATNAIGQAKWSPPARDTTIPTTPKQEQIIVRCLFNAFFNTNGANDTANSHYLKRFTPTSHTCYQPGLVEACAWEIFKHVKSLHTTGFTAPIFDAPTLDAIGQTALWTFEERMNMICDLLCHSKHNAVSLMKGEKIWTIVGAPHKLYTCNVVNKKSNKDRGEWIKAGREGDKRKAAGVEEGVEGPKKVLKMADSGAVVAKVRSAAEIEDANLLLGLRAGSRV